MKKLLLTLGGVLLFISIILGGWLWLSSQIERSVTAELSRALDADVNIASVNTRLFAGQLQLVSGTLASRDRNAPWTRASFAQASVTLKLADLFAPVIPLAVSIDGAELELKPIGATPLPDPAAAVSDALAAGRQSWPRARLHTVSVKNLSLTNPADPTFAAAGIAATIELDPNQSTHTGAVTAATLTARGIALANLALQFTADTQQIRVDNFHAAAGNGLVTGSATLPRNADAAIHFNLSRVPVNLLLSAKWSLIISGHVTGAGDYTGDVFQWRQGNATGTLTLEQAVLKAPPFLQPLKQAFPPLATLGDITLDTAKSDFRYTGGDFTFSNLDLAKNQLLALRGTLGIAADNTLNGRLRLGVPGIPSMLFPKLQSDVFTTEADGWHWADFTVSGTPDNWQEDLTPRIKQAIGGDGLQLLDKAKEGIDKVKQKAGELLDKIFGR